MLEVDALETFYGESQALFGVSLTLEPGEVVTLLRPNGARQRMLGATLSGGEQQMLAIGRALMTNPRLLVLDEATEGLAPLIRGQIWQCLARLKDSGLSILLIDKHVEVVTRLADRHYILE